MSLVQERQNLRFGERLKFLAASVKYRKAVTTREREAIFRQRYIGYLREAAIDPNPENRFTDEYDRSPNVTIYGIYLGGALCASMRIHVASRACRALPAMWAFSDILDPELDAGKLIVDPSRFVVDHHASRKHPELAYITARLGWMAGEHYDADIVLSTARKEHQAFYRRVFNYRVVSECRPYHILKKPLSLLFLDYKFHQKAVEARYPFLESTKSEREGIFGPVPANFRRCSLSVIAGHDWRIPDRQARRGGPSEPAYGIARVAASRLRS